MEPLNLLDALNEIMDDENRDGMEHLSACIAILDLADGVDPYAVMARVCGMDEAAGNA